MSTTDGEATKKAGFGNLYRRTGVDWGVRDLARRSKLRGRRESPILELRAEFLAQVDTPAGPTVSNVVADMVAALGCRRAFGILGGAGVPFFSALVARGLEPMHVRHEAGAVFVALEHELAGGGPGLVFTTTGPGLTNTLTGVAAARREGGRVVVVSAATASYRRGRGAFQETDPVSYAHCGLHTPGGWFDYAVSVESPTDLPVVGARLCEGLQRPQGFTAHLALPLSVQTAWAGEAAPCGQPSARLSPQSQLPSRACVDALCRGPVVIWIGYGARQAAPEIKRLAERLDARVMSSPRGKGIFPETDARYLGVTGFGGHGRVFDRLERAPAATTLVLGSRLGEFTSFWDRRLVGDSLLIHVDVDATAFGAAYPEASTLKVRADVGTFVEALLAAIPARRAPVCATPVHTLCVAPPSSSGPAPAAGKVRPSAIMRSLQSIVVEQTEVPVLAEAGNAFLWTTHALRFDAPGRFRTSMGFGAMGHFTAGVVGTALARGGPAVAVVGDGAMLMSNEVSTAATLGIAAIWIVLNDARYGLVADGMQGLGHTPVGLDFHPVDFAAMARAVGAHGMTVRDEDDLDDALRVALTRRGPVVIDVVVDPNERAPVEARNRSLAGRLAGDSSPGPTR